MSCTVEPFEGTDRPITALRCLLFVDLWNGHGALHQPARLAHVKFQVVDPLYRVVAFGCGIWLTLCDIYANEGLGWQGVLSRSWTTECCQ